MACVVTGSLLEASTAPRKEKDFVFFSRVGTIYSRGAEKALLAVVEAVEERGGEETFTNPFAKPTHTQR